MSGYDVKIRAFRVGVPMLLLVGQRGMEPTSTTSLVYILLVTARFTRSFELEPARILLGVFRTFCHSPSQAFQSI
jgi:hypothetical protein